jgi:arylsulfatase A-like enzyme
MKAVIHVWKLLPVYASLAVCALAMIFGIACQDSVSEQLAAQPRPHLLDRLDCEPRDLPIDDRTDHQQRGRFMVSGTVQIAHAPDSGTHATWKRGTGLSLNTAKAPGTVVFSAPLALGGTGLENLVLRTSADSPAPIRVHWTDERCHEFSGACQTVWQIPGGENAVSRIPFAAKRTGAVRELRLSLEPGQSLAIHSAKAEPAGASPRQTLIGDGRDPVQLGVSQAKAEWLPNGSLRISIPRDATDAHFSWRTDLVALDGASLIVQTAGRARGSIDIFFESPLCRLESGHFSAECRVRANEPSDGNAWVADMGKHARWRGRISRIRIDFNDMNGESFELAAVRVDSRGAPAGWARDDRDAPPLLRRFEIGGPLGWELAAGQALDCAIPAKSDPPSRLPDFLEFNVPADFALLQILELRAYWVDAKGVQELAGLRQERASRRSDSGWTQLALRPPTRWPTALSLEFVCARNCSALDEAGRMIQLARPFIRRRTNANDAPSMNLILIVIDTLRADRLSLYGYKEATDPGLKRWAEQSSVYDRVIAVGTRTIPTHFGLFTGRYPLDAGRHHLGGLPSGSQTLAGLLGHHGYATFAQTDGFLVSPEYGFDIGFDRFEAIYEPARNKFERFIEQIVGHTERGELYFGFLHTYGVHEPYSVSSEERQKAGLPEPKEPSFPVPSSPLVAISQQIQTSPHRALAGAYLGAEYDVGIAAMDSELEFLLAALAERGLLTNTLVAITSDHGEEFLEHGRLGHGIQFPHLEITWVPLIIKEPEQRDGERIPAPLSQAEIPNLLLSRLGVDASLESKCVRPGHPAAFVSTRHYSDHPIDSHFSVAVYLKDCHYYEVSERSTESIIESGVLGKNPQACREARASLNEVVRCMKDEQRERGHYGATQLRDGSGEKERAIDDATRLQLEALGYVE